MFKLATLLALASAAAAKHCVDITVPVSISARNAVFNIQPPTTEVEVTDFFLNFSKQNANYTASVTAGYETVGGDYQLAATYCEPDNGPGDKLQILTHGVGFDRSYWDFPFCNDQYSYVNRAIDLGYSTLSWDRLGIGRSSHGDPVSEIQIFLEVAALRELTLQFRDGNVGGHGLRFEKIVHVGHSFGSAITFALTDMYPDISDAIVLTGFSQVPGFIGLYALGGGFVPVKEIPALRDWYTEGYVALKSSVGVHTNYFGPGDFDPEVLDAATRTGQPATVGELLTVGSSGSTSNFDGAVFIITGGSFSVPGPNRAQLRFPGFLIFRVHPANLHIERDVPFCGGDCLNTVIINNSAPNLIEMSRQSFTKASAFNATIVPGAGHGLNLQYTSSFTYKAILDFLGYYL